jgi:pimeloyl-ACP methyl ester carboxylesterase
VETRGTATDPVVLVHGFSFDRALWEPQVSAWATSHRVITYDLRGFGESGTPAEGRGHVEDLVALLDACGVRRAHLVGLSLGGNISLATAMLHPEHVRSLTLVSTGLPGPSWRGPRPPDQAHAIAAEHGVASAKRWWLDHEIFARTRATALGRRILTEMIERFPAYQWRDGFAAAPAVPATADALARIEAPTLVVSGAHDHPEYRALAVRIAREVPRARLLTMADADHLPNLTDADEFNLAVGRWWDELAAHEAGAPLSVHEKTL